MLKRRRIVYFQILLLSLFMCMPLASFAATSDTISMSLSKNTVAAGEMITVSGVTGSNIGIFIEIWDEQNNLLFIDIAQTDANGIFSADINIPDSASGTLTVSAGSGSNVAKKTLTVGSNTGEVTIPGDDSGGGIGDGINDGSSGGSVGGGVVSTPSGTVAIGGNNTEYNKNAFGVLPEATTEQRENAQLPANAPLIIQGAATPTTLTTNDGVQLVVPAGAVQGLSGSVRFSVEMGSIMSPPRAETTAVVLDPLKYERQFGIEGQAEGSIHFRLPVTINFSVALADLPQGINAGQLAIYWWNPDKNDWVRLGGVFNRVTNKLSVTAYHFSTYAVMADTSTTPNRLSGIDRFYTAISIAEQGWKAGADNIVLANAYSFPDALAAGPLAYKLNAPILLTDAATLTSSTLAEIQKLAPKKIILVGGTGVISQGIQDSLSAIYGKGNVIRYGGTDRYTTASSIAAALGTTGRAVIANGENGHYADALTISTYAAHNGIPILFTQATRLPEATSRTLTNQKVNTTIVAGGEGVVSAAVFKQLDGATRYGGADRYATATAIAGGLNLNLNRVYVVTGLNFSDALVAGNLAAHSLSPLVMVDKGIPAATDTFLKANKAAISGLTIVGGQGVINTTQENTLRDILN